MHETGIYTTLTNIDWLAVKGVGPSMARHLEVSPYLAEKKKQVPQTSSVWVKLSGSV